METIKNTINIGRPKGLRLGEDQRKAIRELLIILSFMAKEKSPDKKGKLNQAIFAKSIGINASSMSGILTHANKGVSNAVLSSVIEKFKELLDLHRQDLIRTLRYDDAKENFDALWNFLYPSKTFDVISEENFFLYCENSIVKKEHLEILQLCRECYGEEKFTIKKIIELFKFLNANFN